MPSTEPFVSTSGGMDTASSAIDEQIKAALGESKALRENLTQVQEKIRLLRSRRNTIVPISKLPSELLSRIFKHYIHGPELKVSQDGDPDYESLDPLASIQWSDIMRILGVCRTWRLTALNCQGFWSQIIYSEPSTHLAEKMLSRSKASPLCIRMSSSLAADYISHIGGHVMSSFRSKVLDIQRLRELHLQFQVHQLNCLLAEIPADATVAENLQSVCIRSEHGVGLITAGPWKLYVHPMPNLRCLEVHRYTVNWEALHEAALCSGFRNLSSLKLTPSDHPPSKEQLYAILSTTPRLATLYLDGALPVISNSVSLPAILEIPGRIVRLPELASCTIKSSSIASCVDFHLNISYPTTTATFHFGVSDVGVFAPDDPSASFVQSLLQTLGLSSDNPARTCANLLCSMRPGLKVALWEGSIDTFPQRLFGFDNQPSVVLDLSECNFEASLELLKRLSISGLVNLGVDHGDIHLAGLRDLWSHFFERHPGILRLHLRATSVANMVNALCTPMRLRRDSNPPPPSPASYRLCFCLPNLDTMILEDHGSPSEDGLVDETLDEIERVVGSLVERRYHHVPIPELHLAHAMGWTVDLYRQAAEAVGSLTWRGVAPPYAEDLKSDSDDEDYVDTDEGGGGGNSAGEESFEYSSSESASGENEGEAAITDDDVDVFWL